jgi:hypothetical protein
MALRISNPWVMRPVVWALLLSCGVHGVLMLQTFLYQAPQTTTATDKAWVVRWLAPLPPTPIPEVIAPIQVPVSQARPIKSAQPATGKRATNPGKIEGNRQPPLPASPQPSIAAPSPQASGEPGPAFNGTPLAEPSTSPTGSQVKDAGTSAAPSTPKQIPKLDLSQANVARAATQANASSLAYKARVHTGLEPEPRAKVFAKSIAATAIPSCWSHTQDGEGQPLVAPSGNLLYLPGTARDAVMGKCKVIP